MSTSYRRSEILPVAEDLVKAIRPFVADVMICGSIRRHKLQVKDIELVVKAHNEPTLFGDPSPDIAGLDRDLANLIEAGALRYDPDLKRDGDRYKRFLVNAPYAGAPSIAVDMFISEERNWGNIVAIRTGDGEFSKLLVTREDHKILTSYGLNRYGFMPVELQQKGGVLCHRGDEHAVIECPTEQSFFKVLGFTDVPDPKERCCTYKKR